MCVLVQACKVKACMCLIMSLWFWESRLGLCQKDMRKSPQTCRRYSNSMRLKPRPSNPSSIEHDPHSEARWWLHHTVGKIFLDKPGKLGRTEGRVEGAKYSAAKFLGKPFSLLPSSQLRQRLSVSMYLNNEAKTSDRVSGNRVTPWAKTQGRFFILTGTYCRHFASVH